MKKENWIQESLIPESLPNGMLRIHLDNEDRILGYGSGRIQRSFIRIPTEDRVKIERSHYDSTKGHIVSRLRNKDSND
ncbi:translational initiation factor 1 (chloroplast) [Quercus robur]|uniref:Translational initiation factor 1 n=1 Tax=Quercus robur TaxID=38942 RepID=A0A6C0MDA5_QUERO|nr:translational initiation factor 1 [Quercus robur]YP_010306728.1 translational initiation factor 1 [Quercus dentata subsp. stewardii]YP_010307158.1 translational initiation factor 1 [Quercus fabri]QHV34537.1 translational initiation factor 1 [Quercus robur]ULU20935.1 translational initiation factor 1 [Quercus dentata subsp. stewardii]ULU21708.1 translational initiation factor 1 [Quercus fabri]SPO52004.1 translational initiation factor 1 [Quercus robur]